MMAWRPPPTSVVATSSWPQSVFIVCLVLPVCLFDSIGIANHFFLSSMSQMPHSTHRVQTLQVRLSVMIQFQSSGVFNRFLIFIFFFLILQCHFCEMEVLLGSGTTVF